LLPSLIFIKEFMSLKSYDSMQRKVLIAAGCHSKEKGFRMQQKIFRKINKKDLHDSDRKPLFVLCLEFSFLTPADWFTRIAIHRRILLLRDRAAACSG